MNNQVRWNVASLGEDSHSVSGEEMSPSCAGQRMANSMVAGVVPDPTLLAQGDMVMCGPIKKICTAEQDSYSPQVMTTTEKLARYETAEEILGKLIAHCSAKIHQEEKQPSPGAAKLAQWRGEQAQLMNEDARLFFGDCQNIERVIAVHGPICKAIYGSHHYAN